MQFNSFGLLFKKKRAKMLIEYSAKIFRISIWNY